MHGRRLKRRLRAFAIGGMMAILAGCAGTGPKPDSTQPEFPWPPPPASAETDIPPNWLPPAGEPTRLADIAAELENALRRAQFRRWSYSSAPNGFALISQMEQIDADGTPSPEPARWSAELPSVREMTILEFTQVLGRAPPGYYRVIVFVATDERRRRDGQRPTGQDAQSWLAKGYNRLPADIEGLAYGPKHRTTALIYEFKRQSGDDAAALVEKSATPGADHLRKAGILYPLSGLE